MHAIIATIAATKLELPSRVRMLIGIRRHLTGLAERIRIDFRRKQSVSRDPLARCGSVCVLKRGERS